MGSIFHACNLTQNASEYQALQGSALVQNIFARFPGSWALRVNASGVALGSAFWGPLGPAGNVSGGSPTTDTYLRTYFAYLIKPAANDEYTLRFEAVSGTQIKMLLTLDSSGHLNAYDMNAVLMASGTFPLVAGQFYRLNVHAGTGANAPWDLQLYDATETLVASMSGTGNLNTNPCSGGRLGKVSVRFNGTVDYYYTDTLVSDSAPPGPGQGAIMVPVGDGFYTNGVANGAGQLWQCVNSLPTDEDATYINGFALGQAYTAVMSTAPFGTVNTYKSHARLKRDGAVNSQQSVRMRSGLIDSDTAIAANATNYNPYQKLFDVDPATGLAWTKGGIESAQVGVVQQNASSCRVTVLYAFIDYVPQSLSGAGFNNETEGMFDFETGSFISTPAQAVYSNLPDPNRFNSLGTGQGQGGPASSINTTQIEGSV